MMLKRPAQLGYTLVELMVVLSISLVLVTMAMVAYGRVNRTKQVEVAARNLETALRQVQSNSYSANVDETGPCTGTFLGMSLVVTEGTNQYANWIRCSGSGLDQVGDTQTVGREVAFQLVGGATAANYLTLGRGLAEAVTFQLVHVDDASLCWEVAVAQTGEIEVRDTCS